MKTTGLALFSVSLLTACAPPPTEGGGLDEGGGIDLGGTEGEDESGTQSGDEDPSGSDGESGGDDMPGGGSGGDADDAPHCGGDRVEVTAVPPNVMLVLDKSGSMTQRENDWDHDGDPSTPAQSRWTSLHDVVSDLLARHDEAMNFGAVLFPAVGADTGWHGDACLMEDEAEVPIAPGNGANVLAAMPGRLDKTSGGTPARFGVLNAVDHLVDLETEGSRVIVLVTDGEANCVPGVSPFHSQYDDELELAVWSAYEDLGITTYVVGIAIDDRDLSGSNDGRTLRDAMNDLARAGGAARSGEGDAFYAVSDHDALQAALDEIAARVGCTVELDAFPANPAGGEVTVDGQRYGEVASCDEGDGWRFVSETAPFDTIELCGNACDQFLAVGAMEATYECLPAG